MTRPPASPRHPTCAQTTDLVSGTPAYVCTAYCPAPAGPDPERDARRAAYRARERARMTHAFSRFLRDAYATQAGSEREAQIQHDAWWAGYEASEEHHRSHYGVSLPAQRELLRCPSCGAGPYASPGNLRGHMDEECPGDQVAPEPPQ